MSRKIIGVTVGTTLPKPNFDQTDPRKGDYIRGDRAFITPDDTLTQPGRPAEAKATGDAIQKIQTNIDEFMLSIEDQYYTGTEIDDKFKSVQSNIDSKVDAEEGKGLSSEDYTITEKNKLSAIEDNANNYEHPTYTSYDSGLYKVTVDSFGHVTGATIAGKEDIVALGVPEQDTIYDDSDLKSRMADAEDDIKRINEEFGDFDQEFKDYQESNNNAVSANAKAIENNQIAIKSITDDYLTSTDKKALQADILEVSKSANANKDAIEVLNGDGQGSVNQSITNAFNEFAANITNDNVINTYKELIDYAAKHGPEFAELVGEVDDTNERIDGIEIDFAEYKDNISDQFIEVGKTINDLSDAMQEDLEKKSDVDHNHDDLYYDKDEILGLITSDDIDDICESIQSSDENIDLVNVATKYWVQAYYQPKGDYLKDSDMSNHNAAENSHSDIRLLIKDLADNFYAFAKCDDETLNQLQEVVNYIKSNASLIAGITTTKVNVADIINNLTTNADDKPLSAAQGVILKGLIDSITVPTKISELDNDSGYIKSYTETDPTVPAWAKTPNKPTYTADEVGAASTEHKHAIAVTGSNESSAVTGFVTVPTVSQTQKYMTASADAPTVTPTTDSVLGADTKFTVSGGTAYTTKLAVSASDVIVGASGTVDAITGFGEHTTASVITDLNTTTIKNPTVTPVSIPNVTGNDDVTASKVSATAGIAASWSASVSNGVLSFDWVTNTPTAVTATDVSASKVTLGEDLSASSVSTNDVTVATGSKNTTDAITVLGTPTTSTAITGVEVTTQPVINLITTNDDEIGNVTVATGISDISITASGDNVETLTNVSVEAPAITLVNNNSDVSGSVPVVSSVNVGTASASLQNGSAAAQKWTQSTGVAGTPQ